MNVSAWHNAGSTFSFHGHRIFFRDSGGERPVLLLIHGFPTASWDWHTVWDALSQHFRLLAPDMLGFGFSDKPRGHDYRIHEQADLHLALLEHLNVDQCHTLAHDYGVSVMQEILARHKAKETRPQFLSACFLNGGLFPVTHKPRLIQKLLLSPIGPLLSKLSSKRQFTRSFSQVFGPQTQPSNAELDAFWDLIQYNNGMANAHRLIRYMEDRITHQARWEDAIKHPGIPTRLINGPEDPISGRHLAEYYSKQVPKADVVLLEGIGHYPQVEDPEGVLKAFFAFNPVTKI